MAAWPENMTAKELFTALTPAKRPNFGGAYLMFLASHLMRHLQPVDLPDALHWVEHQGPKDKLKHPFVDLVDKGALARVVRDVLNAFFDKPLLDVGID